MKIGIDVNGVLRDTYTKFQRVYESNLIENNLENDPNNHVLEEVEEFVYEFEGPITSSTLTDFFKFKDQEEYLKFMYEEFPMQIFGHAPSTEMNTFNILNETYLEFRSQHDLLIVSNEIGKAKPSTLFFLSKFGCLFEKIVFYSQSTIDSLWNEVDILVTSNSELLENHPSGKILIKYETEYNKQIDSPLKIKSLEELSPLLKELIK